jgi:hypothetical protein
MLVINVDSSVISITLGSLGGVAGVALVFKLLNQQTHNLLLVCNQDIIHQRLQLQFQHTIAMYINSSHL